MTETIQSFAEEVAARIDDYNKVWACDRKKALRIGDSHEAILMAGRGDAADILKDVITELASLDEWKS